MGTEGIRGYFRGDAEAIWGQFECEGPGATRERHPEGHETPGSGLEIRNKLGLSGHRQDLKLCW